MREARVPDTRGWLPLRPAKESVFGWPGFHVAFKTVALSFSAVQVITRKVREHRKKTGVNSAARVTATAITTQLMEALYYIMPPSKGSLQGNLIGVGNVNMSENSQQRLRPGAETDSIMSEGNTMQDTAAEVDIGTGSPTTSPKSLAVITLDSSSENAANSADDNKDVIVRQGASNGPRPSLFVLPDELISLCYDGLPAKDLVVLEQVNSRLREMVSSDSQCWRTCVKTRYSNTSNSSITDRAAAHAGGWKKFYAEKVKSAKESAPWVVPSASETLAIVDLIKGDAPSTSTTDPDCLFSMEEPPSKHQELAKSPSSIMHEDPAILSVVLLIDGSSSVTEDDFNAMKEFTRALIGSLRMTHPDAAVALIQFNQYPRVDVELSTVSNSNILHRVDTIEQMMGSTDIAAPIRRARLILYENARPGEKAIILLSDGQTHADELEESEREATIAADLTGARVFALGVGRDVDEVGLTRVSNGSRTSLEGNNRPRDMNGAYFTLRKLRK